MRIHRLNDAENRVRQTTWAFADGRFEDPEVIEWAIALTPEQETERISLRELCDRQRRALREPYALAWRCIFEFWRAPQTQTAHDALLVRRELKQGGRLREAIKLIVNAVAPWLKVETARRFQSLAAERAPKRPRHLKHLLYASISSGKRLTPQDIGLAEIGDRDFLFELRYSANSNFVPATQACLRNVVRYGPAYLYAEEGFGGTLIHYASIPVVEAYIGRNRWGITDTFHRKYERTARQAAQILGYENLPPKVKAMVDDPKKSEQKKASPPIK